MTQAAIQPTPARLPQASPFPRTTTSTPNARSLPLLRVNGLAGHRWQGGKSSDTQTVRKGQYQG